MLLNISFTVWPHDRPPNFFSQWHQRDSSLDSLNSCNFLHPPRPVRQVLHKAVKHKAEIVAIDEKETGLRATLKHSRTDFMWTVLGAAGVNLGWEVFTSDASEGVEKRGGFGSHPGLGSSHFWSLDDSATWHGGRPPLFLNWWSCWTPLGCRADRGDRGPGYPPAKC